MLKKKRGAQSLLPKKKKQTAVMLNKIHVPSPATLEPPILSKLSVPMRILMVIDQLNIGGTETYTLSITRELIKKGAIVVIACKKGKLLEHFLGLGCPFYEIDFVLDNYELDHENHIKNLQLLKSVILSERIDLVHGHQIPSGSLARTAADQMNIPYVFTVHGAYYDKEFLDSAQKNSTITCVSPSIRRLLKSKGIDSKVIANGIDTHEYHAYGSTYLDHFRDRLGIPHFATIILYAGRLSWEKGEIGEEIIHTIDAMRNNGYPNLHLIIAGGGNKQEDIIKLATTKQQPGFETYIHYVGEVMNMGAYYSLSDCVIGTGRVALEAMSCERPLIASGSRGLLGIVKPENYEKAWDCWFGDHDSDKKLSRALLTAHLRKIINMEPKAKSHLVQSAKKFVNDRFQISQMVEQLIDIYRQSIQLGMEDEHKRIAQQK
ncbi:glycosyltransferase [Paenibacillus radicis (ex Xue et al. 2023)]|uniref:Glycosyltransferase n=1 Tax=Paenibacillus radicis (ex Xue et al. 2023) TaxID=2972489 RepID=A0ABT1YI88_9BACL|nr:glycosyltransferase [Paenibacillus radicis (ex Xue et al. 2023)]MCR8632898.1 glycosyltransferase [Paenibacillus radicis (ex Xue et al. 2023)]